MCVLCYAMCFPRFVHCVMCLLCFCHRPETPPSDPFDHFLISIFLEICFCHLLDCCESVFMQPGLRLSAYCEKAEHSFQNIMENQNSRVWPCKLLRLHYIQSRQLLIACWLDIFFFATTTASLPSSQLPSRL